MQNILEFIQELQSQSNTSIISNPYLSNSVAENLRIYLDAMLRIRGKRILLVGEAPGYKGCKITGIPFTSGDVFETVEHPFLKKIKKKIKLENIEKENTASIVWRYLAEKKITPLFWNSFPYHPHPKDDENKNRAPNRQEIDLGVVYLIALNQLFKPKVIAGIGNAGVKCAKLAFPETKVIYIRHPSFGGKTDFIKGMDSIID